MKRRCKNHTEAQFLSKLDFRYIDWISKFTHYLYFNAALNLGTLTLVDSNKVTSNNYNDLAEKIKRSGELAMLGQTIASML